MQAYKVCSLFFLIFHSQRDKEGPPSLSCHSFLFNATRRVHPPRRVIPSFSTRQGGSALLIVSFFHSQRSALLVVSFVHFQHDKAGGPSSLCHSLILTRRGGSILLVVSFLSFQCDEEGPPSSPCRSFIDATRRVRSPRCVIHSSFSTQRGGRTLLAVSFPYF